MPPLQLKSALTDFQQTITACTRLAGDARKWSMPGAPQKLSRSRRDSLIELAFLRSFLAWEGFIEDSFILYMLGKLPPKGKAPVRFVLPPTRPAAHTLAAGGRAYAKWDDSQDVVSLAERFFRGGVPYAGVLRSKQQLLQDVKTIRNACAHDSTSAREKFEGLVRRELTVLPPKLTVGGFLDTTNPKAATPASFFEFYLGQLEGLAERIVKP